VLGDPDLEQKTCRFCGRVFSSYVGMRRHVRGTCKIAPTTRNGGVGMEFLYKYTIQQAAELEALKTQMQSITQQIGGPADGSAAPPGAAAGEVAVLMGDGNRVAVDNSKHVTINVFGQEGVNHATMARIRGILDESMKAPALPEAAQAAVLRTAQLIYSDPAHPENLTCFLPNKKTNDALVHGASGWEVQPVSLVLPPMAKRSVDTLFDQQPYEDAETYGALMKELSVAEAKHADGLHLRPILTRNKGFLGAALAKLPVAGGTGQKGVDG